MNAIFIGQEDEEGKPCGVCRVIYYSIFKPKELNVVEGYIKNMNVNGWHRRLYHDGDVAIAWMKNTKYYNNRIWINHDG